MRPSLITLTDYLARHIDRRPVPELPGLHRLGPMAKIQGLLTACNARLEAGGRIPSYSPGLDVIRMPSPVHAFVSRSFMGQRRYALDCAHEATHWTGHRSRLARIASCDPTTAAYHREELVAEIGSALLLHDLAIKLPSRLPHARYLDSWLAALPNPTLDLDIALGRANQAAGYMIALARRNLMR